jgi:glycosyltransferase involved in cell wall biosynthesis
VSLRVLILNDQASVTGGAAAVALSSARGLAAQGVPVTLFTAVGPVAQEIKEVPGLEVICLDQAEIVDDPNRLRAMVNGIANRSVSARLQRVLDDLDPAETIIHVHSWMKALSPLALHTAIRRGFKVVVTLHDFFITCPTGGFFLPKTGQLCHRVPLSASCLACSCDRRHYVHKLWRSARTFFQNQLLHVPAGVAHYVGVSQFSLSIMRPYLPAGTPVTVVRNPVACVDEGPAPVADNAPVLFIGRFTQEKGVLLAAEACRRTGVPAVFIGDGELAAEARAICPNATFTGWLKEDAIRAWLRKARALLFPPLWYETLGLVAIEAAAAGVPAIVSDGCAAAEFVADGERGFHFTHGSLDALCAQIERMQDPTTAARLGRNAYDWYWSKPWSIENHVDELLTLYRSMLHESPLPLAT